MINISVKIKIVGIFENTVVIPKVRYPITHKSAVGLPCTTFTNQIVKASKTHSLAQSLLTP